jgi:hypothetical protein
MLIAALTSLILATSAPVAPTGEPRRFALAVGDNVGDRDDEPLRFAGADARAFVETLEEVGRVAHGDAVLLLDADAASLSTALDGLRARLAAAGSAGQLFVYVSSHADAGDLHLVGSHFSMERLNAFMKEVPASVAVLVVDSCRSGSLTRLKGLKPLTGFSVNLELPDVRGRVVITSSGANEYAQESDRYSGSYFTHHLLSAMRGAADLSHDGLVTLQEAYSYAYRMTVETTFATSAGTQHPSYLVDLKGQGDLVLSDLNHVDGRLSLNVADAGQWIVARQDGDLVGEFEKAAGRAVFALAPGRYKLRMRDGDKYRETSVTVPWGGEASVTDADLGSAQLVTEPRKGGGSDGGTRSTTWALGLSAEAAAVSGLPVLPGLELLARRDLPSGLINTYTGSATLDLEAGGAAVNEDELAVQVGAGHHWIWQPVVLRAAAEAGAALVLQTNAPGSSSHVSTVPFIGARAEGQVRLGGSWSLLLSFFGGPTVVQKEGGWQWGDKLEGTLALARTF